MFMPVRAYIPPGTLRAAVTYPRATHEREDGIVVKALADVGLDHLEPLLDTADRWDRRLTDDEKQRVAFARIVLHRPLWIVVQNALDVLDPDSRLRIRALMMGDFAGMGVINIGHDMPEEGVYARKLHLQVDPGGVSFKPAHEHGLRTPEESADAAPAAE
ncbi:MAG: hypothetical protein JO107_12920 [Hyphomicrobiales bacterium]|nr:hypothetical protein [Hyphomicrobiales bacterium]